MSAKHCGGCGGPIVSTWRYCGKCGHPTGLVVAAAPSGSKAIWIPIVVVLLLVAVAVMGIVAAIAIPNFITATQKAKQKRTMADIRSVATAVEAYAVDYNTYPPYGASLDEVLALVEPTYVRSLNRSDGWGREFRYHCLEPQGDVCLQYAFQSAGKDGTFEDLPFEIETEVRTQFDCDILYANGAFVWYPDGTNQGGR